MHLPVTVEVVAAFVDEREGGNLAGVVLDRDDLSEAQMQSIAAEVGYSETAFLTDVGDGFRFDVFTPNTSVPDCGHATIASFALLAERRRFTTATIKYTVNGPRAIRLDADGLVFMQQLPPRYEAGPQTSGIARSLGLDETTSFAGSPTVARHDVAFLLVPLVHAGLLSTIVPDMHAIEAISQAVDAYGYYVFAPTDDRAVDATIRMFAPRIGIREESATGMGAGMLASFLHDRAGWATKQFAFDQGVFMQPPSPSRLRASLGFDDRHTPDVWVGGRSRTRDVRIVAV